MGDVDDRCRLSGGRVDVGGARKSWRRQPPARKCSPSFNPVEGKPDTTRQPVPSQRNHRRRFFGSAISAVTYWPPTYCQGEARWCLPLRGNGSRGERGPAGRRTDSSSGASKHLRPARTPGAGQPVALLRFHHQSDLRSGGGVAGSPARLIQQDNARQATPRTESRIGTEITEVTSMPMPSSGGNTTPPTIEAATT